MDVKMTQRRSFARGTTRCETLMENQSANCFLTLPIGDKILEVEIPSDDVSPQGALEDEGPSGGCLAQGILGQDEVLLEVGAGEDQKVILERIWKKIINVLCDQIISGSAFAKVSQKFKQGTTRT